MPFSRCPRSRIAAHLALTAIFTATPALAQSKPALSLDESLQIAVTRSRQIVSTDAPLLSMFVIPAAYLLMRRPRERLASFGIFRRRRRETACVSRPIAGPRLRRG